MLTTATAAPITDRTDFARQLHAQLSELRLKICNAPADSGELADRLRAQAAQATSLDFGPRAEALSACEAILRGADVLGRIDDADLEQLSEAFDQISALLNAETERERTPTSGPMPLVGTAAAHGSRTASAAMPVNVLLVGPVALVGTLQEGSRTPFRIERVESVAAAKTLAPTLPPDVVVLDTDTDGAMDLVQSLADDALTDAIPIIALGRWRSPAAAAPYLALGVARCLSKPVAAEALRQTCAEVTVLHAGNSFEPVGKTSVDGLGSRLADELQRALCDAAEPDVRGRAFDFGDGADIYCVPPLGVDGQRHFGRLH